MRSFPVEVYVYLICSLNNTHINLQDPKTNHSFFNSSSGCFEKVKSKRSSSVSALILSEASAKVACTSGFSECSVFIKGFGKGRSGALKGLVLGGLSINNIYHINSISFNGCRQRKKRRLLIFPFLPLGECLSGLRY